jgi:hypothetical protein
VVFEFNEVGVVNNGKVVSNTSDEVGHPPARPTVALVLFDNEVEGSDGDFPPTYVGFEKNEGLKARVYDMAEVPDGWRAGVSCSSPKYAGAVGLEPVSETDLKISA